MPRTLTKKVYLRNNIFSLGMSWLSGRLTKKMPVASSMLDSLKASILGLGNAHCEVIYQDCDLKDETRKRRRRRRKRFIY